MFSYLILTLIQGTECLILSHSLGNKSFLFVCLSSCCGWGEDAAAWVTQRPWHNEKLELSAPGSMLQEEGAKINQREKDLCLTACYWSLPAPLPMLLSSHFQREKIKYLNRHFTKAQYKSKHRTYVPDITTVSVSLKGGHASVIVIPILQTKKQNSKDLQR